MIDMAVEYFNSINSACRVRQIKEKTCSVALDTDNIPKHIIISMEHEKSPIPANKSRCDYIFASDSSNKNDIWQNSWVVPIELKSGTFDPSTVVKQLQSGADFVKDTICKNCKSNFMPLLVHGPGQRKVALNKLKEKTIRYGGKRYPIKRIRCGRSLINALTEYEKESKK